MSSREVGGEIILIVKNSAFWYVMVIFHNPINFSQVKTHPTFSVMSHYEDLLQVLFS